MRAASRDSPRVAEARKRPVLTPAAPLDSETAAARDRNRPSFEQEAREPGWAAEHERELQLRLRRVVDGLARRSIAVDIDGIECRRTLCRIAVHAGGAAALGSLYGALESPEGLAGWADAVVLAPVESSASGEVTSHVLAWFERE